MEFAITVGVCGGSKQMRRYKRKKRWNGKSSFSFFTKRMWKSHRAKLMSMPFRQRGKWVASQFKKRMG